MKKSTKTSEQKSGAKQITLKIEKIDPASAGLTTTGLIFQHR